MSMQEYTPVQEKVFTAEHPEVVASTAFFHERVAKRRIFETFESRAGGRSLAKAIAVGGAWHAFSEFMPWFLCEAAARVSTNQKRHYVIQTAFEELGMRREDEIHHEMFWSAAERVGLSAEHRARIAKNPKVSSVLAGLRAALEGAVSDAEILGLLLGLEMPADENIDTVFNALAHSDEAARELAQTRFFLIHRAIETEHVRLTVSNYLRFCRTEVAKAQYKAGFDAGTQFWSRFWSMAADLVAKERKESVDIARIA